MSSNKKSPTNKANPAAFVVDEAAADKTTTANVVINEVGADEAAQNQGSNGNGPVAVGLLANLRQRVAALSTIPARLREWFNGQVQAAWAVAKGHKVRVFLTIVLLLTVIGAIGALYLWRREINELVTHIIDKVVERAQAMNPFSFLGKKGDVVVAQSLNDAGVERTVYKKAQAE